jgi:phage gp29-like protein
MTPITDPAVIAQLLTAINSDGNGSETIDRIISATSVPAQGYEGDDTVVIAQSGSKQLVFLMNDTRPKGETFQSRILNPDDLGDEANFAEYDLAEDDRDDLDILADRVRSIDAMKPWIESLSQGLDGINNLADFAEYLTEAWDKLDPKEFRSRMTEAMTIASMAGYLEAGTDAQ